MFAQLVLAQLLALGLAQEEVAASAQAQEVAQALVQLLAQEVAQVQAVAQSQAQALGLALARQKPPSALGLACKACRSLVAPPLRFAPQARLLQARHFG